MQNRCDKLSRLSSVPHPWAARLLPGQLRPLPDPGQLDPPGVAFAQQKKKNSPEVSEVADAEVSIVHNEEYDRLTGSIVEEGCSKRECYATHAC